MNGTELEEYLCKRLYEIQNEDQWYAGHATKRQEELLNNIELNTAFNYQQKKIDLLVKGLKFYAEMVSESPEGDKIKGVGVYAKSILKEYREL